MNKLTIAISVLVGSWAITPLASIPVQAENVKIPIGSGSQVWSGKVPKRGSTKAQVQSEFGAPDSTQGPNGQPPIYFWEYPDFTVYFESDHVIHTVIKHRPKAS